MDREPTRHEFSSRGQVLDSQQLPDQLQNLRNGIQKIRNERKTVPQIAVRPAETDQQFWEEHDFIDEREEQLDRLQNRLEEVLEQRTRKERELQRLKDEVAAAEYDKNQALKTAGSVKHRREDGDSEEDDWIEKKARWLRTAEATMRGLLELRDRYLRYNQPIAENFLQTALRAPPESCIIGARAIPPTAINMTSSSRAHRATSQSPLPSPKASGASAPVLNDDIDPDEATSVDHELSENELGEEFLDAEEGNGFLDEDEEDDDDDEEVDDDDLDEEGESITRAELLDLLNGDDGGGNPSTAATQREEGEEEDDDDEDEVFELQLQNDPGTRGGAAGGGTQAAPRAMRISRSQFLRFIRQPGALQGIFGAGADDEDDDDDYNPGSLRRQRRGGLKPSPFPKVPSDTGRELMESGTFGTNDRLEGTYERGSRLGHRIMQRELGLSSLGKERSRNKLAMQKLIPSSSADKILHYDRRCYSGQFSDDGNFFFSCSQDFNVRMYDTSNPYNWSYYKTVHYPVGQWTITDASLSPDNRFLAYSSIRSIVCLAATDPEADSDPHMLNLSDSARTRGNDNFGIWSGHFGIWSVRFSGDGRELVAGTSDSCVCAYDIETRQTVLRIQGHTEDVNAVCFGDKMSPHLLYSGSDDATVKVWDRRSMSEKRAAGVFLGHTEGLTYIDSKGDGRYVLSNGKDQTMKLWDLRKMVDTNTADQVDSDRYSMHFDYRFETYDTSKYYKHPYDCSLVTFRGHSVLKTLIRCHFSPPGSTDGRYVYTGSEDGSVYVYNLDATIAGKINVRQATLNTRPRGQDDSDFEDFDDDDAGTWRTCVRDASWHPNAPIVAATSWNGYSLNQGTCSVHSWNDGMNDDEADPPMGLRVNDKLIPDQTLYDQPALSPQALMRRRRQLRQTRLANGND
ncbi:MAG: hypothetical protein Q9162_007039 [Coniocarpon cinnabarinum]